MYTCMWRPGVDIGRQSLSTLLIEAWSLEEPGAYQS